eukprot:3688411-Pyramimonas_sp.AAC.1
MALPAKNVVNTRAGAPGISEQKLEQHIWRGIPRKQLMAFPVEHGANTKRVTHAAPASPAAAQEHE